MEFKGNNPKKVEIERKKWINKNNKIWTQSIKPEETIFHTKRSRTMFESKNLIEGGDLENWKNIVNNNSDKLWIVIKRKIKEKLKLYQVHKWRMSKEGKVLKKYKNYWWIDNIIQEVNNPLIHDIRRMRLGCSKLRNHMSKRNLRLCKNCDMKIPETNEHFFEVCPKYEPQRELLKRNVNDVMKSMKVKFNTLNLMGMNNKIMQSKHLKKKHKSSILVIF